MSVDSKQTENLAIDKQGLENDQRIKDYLEEELEFADAFSSKIVQAHSERDWRRLKDITYFREAVVGTITDWRRRISRNLEECTPEGEPEEASDDPNDSTYCQEIFTPTSLYQWAYLYLKFIPADRNLADDEQLHELVVRIFRTQHYDAELCGLGSQNAYPPAEDLVSRPLSLVPKNAMSAGPAFIHQLPPEILSDIFLRARDGLLYLPLIVSHVDSRFRAIAESTALLWTTIDVYLPLPLVSLYLQRSSPALLDVRVDFYDMGLGQDSVRAFIAVVADHRPRIASLSMSATWEELTDEIVEAMMGLGLSYPQLRTLDTGYRKWRSPRHAARQPSLLRCPVVVPHELQELSLWGSRSRDWAGGFPEPLEQLTSLHLLNNINLFLSDVLIVLANLPNLKTLVIRECIIREETLTGSSAVTLPSLTMLEYATLSNKSIASMSHALLSPKLTSLKLWWDYNSDGFGAWHTQAHTWLEQAQALTAMLSANPQLESLDLCHCAIEQQGWKEPFSKARSLKCLRLLWCESESNNLEALLDLGLEENFEQDLLPSLEHLVLDNVFHLTTKDIRRILTRRPGLRFLELRGWDGSKVAEEDVQFIRESVERFILETFCNGSGLLDEEDEGSEEESSSGTPSEGSWLSGDNQVYYRIRP